MLESFEHFFVNVFVCLTEILSSLGMSKYYILNACIYEHSRSDLTCVSTFLLKVHVLSTNLDVCSFSCLNNRDDVDSRYAEYYVNFIVNNKRF